MAKEFLLVDGYNIIHAWSELRELVEDVSLESARQRLMDILSNYKGTKQATVILVFDGYLVKGNIGTVYEYNNIFVVYTKEAETADHYIERVVTSMPKHYKVRVATGDGLEQLIIYGQGAIRMTARELWNEVTAAETELRETDRRKIIFWRTIWMRKPWHGLRNCVEKNKQQRRIFMTEMTREQKYATTRDEELVLLAQSGDEEAQEFLLDKYKFLVRAKSRAYFLIGADNEDIIQEGMIGLYKAVRDYNEEKNASFHSFAELCVNRQMITAIKAATRQKHQPLNSYVSLNKPVYEEESEQTYMDLLQSGALLNPEVLLIGQENKSFLEHQMMKKLSSFETRVLVLYLQGRSYFEIARVLDKPEKSIDNALQRVKKKLEHFLEEKNLDEAEGI